MALMAHVSYHLQEQPNAPRRVQLKSNRTPGGLHLQLHASVNDDSAIEFVEQHLAGIEKLDGADAEDPEVHAVLMRAIGEALLKMADKIQV